MFRLGGKFNVIGTVYDCDKIYNPDQYLHDYLCMIQYIFFIKLSYPNTEKKIGKTEQNILGEKIQQHTTNLIYKKKKDNEMDESKR